MDESSAESPTVDQPTWRPIGRNERRVLGVLVEKAKTTPEAYPLTLNSLTNGCNQKNNRFPKLDLEPIDVQNALEKLTSLGAVSEIPSGRVEKFRHFAPDWLEVSSIEVAIMAELLLRGAQSLGDLRGRANRMSAIASVSDLRPIVHSLMHRGLVVPLTEQGRGQIVTHNLYSTEELTSLRQEYNNGVVVEVADQPKPKTLPTEVESPVSEMPQRAPAPAPVPVPDLAPSTADPVGTSGPKIEALQKEVADLKAKVERLLSEVDDIWSNIGK